MSDGSPDEYRTFRKVNMQKFQAMVYDSSSKMRDNPLSSDDWNLFLFQLDGRIRKLDKEFRSSLKFSVIVPLVAAIGVAAALLLWPPGAVIVLLALPCYIALIPHRYNPVARARHIWRLKLLWVNERDRQTAPDAVNSLK